MDFSQVWVCENENHPSYTVVEINWSPSDEAQHHPMLSAGSSDHQSHRQQQHWSGTRTPSELSLPSVGSQSWTWLKWLTLHRTNMYSSRPNLTPHSSDSHSWRPETLYPLGSRTSLFLEFPSTSLIISSFSFFSLFFPPQIEKETLKLEYLFPPFN